MKTKPMRRDAAASGSRSFRLTLFALSAGFKQQFPHPSDSAESCGDAGG
jgi:hypothetical protein